MRYFSQGSQGYVRPKLSAELAQARRVQESNGAKATERKESNGAAIGVAVKQRSCHLRCCQATELPSPLLSSNGVAISVAIKQLLSSNGVAIKQRGCHQATALLSSNGVTIKQRRCCLATELLDSNSGVAVKQRNGFTCDAKMEPIRSLQNSRERGRTGLEW